MKTLAKQDHLDEASQQALQAEEAVARTKNHLREVVGTDALTNELLKIETRLHEIAVEIYRMNQ